MPLVFYDRGSSDWTLSQGLFRREGILPNVVLEVEGIRSSQAHGQSASLASAFCPRLLSRMSYHKASWRRSTSPMRNLSTAIWTSFIRGAGH